MTTPPWWGGESHGILLRWLRTYDEYDVAKNVCSPILQIPVSVLSHHLVSKSVRDNSAADSDLIPVDVSRAATSWRRLDVNVGLLGVSGERKVAVVVAKHRRTMLLYEMEVEDDEDEDEELDEQEKSSLA